ncbi:MAG: hypothetical protein M0C28_47400 [Candidatus Moduliflexus flocculans]|nr:hypothetical protein [Candidatus Moduliflexus flocculans]
MQSRKATDPKEKETLNESQSPGQVDCACP